MNDKVLSSEEQEFKEAVKSARDLKVRCCHLRKARCRGWRRCGISHFETEKQKKIVLEGAKRSHLFSCSKAGAESLELFLVE